MIKVTVANATVRTHSGVTAPAKGSKPYTMHFQEVYFHTFDRQGKPHPFPQRTEIVLDKDDKGNPMPYAPGEYLLHPSSLYIDRRGDLAVAPRLAAVKG